MLRTNDDETSAKSSFEARPTIEGVFNLNQVNKRRTHSMQEKEMLVYLLGLKLIGLLTWKDCVISKTATVIYMLS